MKAINKNERKATRLDGISATAIKTTQSNKASTLSRRTNTQQQQQSNVVTPNYNVDRLQPVLPPQFSTPQSGDEQQPQNVGISLLDQKWAASTRTIAIVLSFCVLGNWLWDSYDDGNLWTEFADLIRVTKKLHYVLALNFIGHLFTFLFWVLQRVRNSLGFGLTLSLYILGQLTLLLGPVYTLRNLVPDYSPLLGVSLTMQHCVFIMKMHSYFFWHMENKVPKKDKTLSFRSFYQFLWFPSLVFKTDFPRTQKIRWGYVLQCFVLSFASFLALYILICHGLFANIMLYPKIGYIRMLYRMMGPCYMLFFVGFFGVFHCFLNGISEVMMYRDRDFYEAWWESSDFQQWTRSWNKIVQTWISINYNWLRHKVGCSRSVSVFVTIFISACWHDFIISVSMKQFGIWTILFMSFDVILIFFSQTYIGKKIGNFGAPVVLSALSLGFTLLMSSYMLCFNLVDKGVCLPHDLASIPRIN